MSHAPAASGVGVARRAIGVSHASKPADEFHAWLRSVQTRAIDLSQAIERLHIRERAPSWPRLLSQFGLLCASLQALYDELLTHERAWSSRLHSSLTLCAPLSGAYNPATALRVKPTAEADAFEAKAFDAYRADAELVDYSPAELRDQINDFNAAALKLARWAAQAQALPLPKDPPVAQVKRAISRPDVDRIEEGELQKTLASMMTGRLTRLAAPPTQPLQPLMPHQIAQSANAQPMHGQLPTQQQQPQASSLMQL